MTRLSAALLALVVTSTTGVSSADPAPSLAPSMERHALATHPHPRGRTRPFRPNGPNAIADPGFESGFTYWQQCGNVNASITSAKPHAGKYAQKSGSTAGEPSGDEGVCQAIVVPPNGKLTFWTYKYSNEPDPTYAYQEAQLFDDAGTTVKQLYRTVDNTDGWISSSYDLSDLAGRTLYLYFGVHGDGYAGSYAIQFVDDVWLTSGPAP